MVVETAALLSVATTWDTSASHEQQSESETLVKVETVVRDFRVEDTARTLVRYCRPQSNNIALQFPDSLLYLSAEISQLLSLFTEDIAKLDTSQVEKGDNPLFFFYVLGDTSYGECCVDEVAAQHLETHLIIHYGDACLSPTRSLPVFYVFPTPRIENAHDACNVVQNTLSEIASISGVDRIVILHDVHLHTYFTPQQFRLFDNHLTYVEAAAGKPVDVARLRLTDVNAVQLPATTASIDSSSVNTSVGPLCYDATQAPPSRTAFVWFTSCATEETDTWPATVRNAALTLCTGPTPCAIFRPVALSTASASTPSSSLPPPDAQRLLRRRFAQLVKARDAERIGIIAGTLGVAGNIEVIDRCKRVIKAAGKCVYVMVVGKLNAAKLANFAEIDVFVLVACPQNAFIEDTKDFLQPIITPLELEASLRADGDIFTRVYSPDFCKLLEEELVLENDDNSDGDGDGDGDGAHDGEENGVVGARDEWSMTVNGSGGGADFLGKRAWQGLKYGQGGRENDTEIGDLSLEVHVGQYGLASRYDNEADYDEGNTESASREEDNKGKSVIEVSETVNN